MQYSQYLAELSGNVERMVAALGNNPGVEIPSCPGWAAADLLAHMANVLAHKLPLFRMRLETAPEPASWCRTAAGDPDLGATVLRTAEEVGAELAAIGPDVALWSWYERDRSSSFWARRLAHEAAIHRVDAELAAGLVPDCRGELAADGVGELLEVFLARPGRPLGDGGAPAVVDLDGTDLPCQWSVAIGDTEVVVHPGHNDSPDAVLRGPVSALYLWGWGRLGLGEIAVTGDQSLPGRLRALAARAT
ncbi:MAG: maleylpyruvate isomerase family mycothiol-dependent enzyme [Candidatus Dormibacteria bacterium]